MFLGRQVMYCGGTSVVCSQMLLKTNGIHWQNCRRHVSMPSGLLRKQHVMLSEWILICWMSHTHAHTHTRLTGLPRLAGTRNIHTQPFHGPFSRTTRVSRYQKVKTNLDFTEARNNEWQRHQLGHMQVCTSLQTDNHSVFYRPDALTAAAQPAASKHWRHK